MNILGYQLRKNKYINFELTKIYGIGIKTANKICKKINIMNKKVYLLKENEIIKINKNIKKIKIGNDLKKQIKENIKNLINIKCYRGIRHNKKLPVRGQRTRTNSKTSRKNINN
ncbi:MAG: 30S ribosomal protein S13 [Candidatus Vidania fulgoroideorum]